MQRSGSNSLNKGKKAQTPSTGAPRDDRVIDDADLPIRDMSADEVSAAVKKLMGKKRH
jgi:hypothetical protein